jgi:succinate-acetate transporter protein
VFLTLEITEILLFIGNFATSTSIIKAGGYLGVITALVAWYTSAAGVINGMAARPFLFVGRPLIDLAAPRAVQEGSPLPRRAIRFGRRT